MSNLLLSQATITGLPHQLHEGKVITLKYINYFFGSNGSGKTLVLKNITEQVKQTFRSGSMGGDGYFAQYITATPQQNFYQDSYQILV